MTRPKTIPDEQVVQAVGRVLLRVGPAHFSLQDVGGECGLSPATLVQRFGSKRGLVLAFARASAQEATAPFERARSKLASPLAALREALLSAAKDLRTRQEVANSLAVLLIDITDDEMRTLAAQHAHATEKAIRTLLDEAVQAGELEKGLPPRLALSIQAAWNGAVIQWALRGQESFSTLLTSVLAPLLPMPKARRAKAKPKTRSRS